MTDPTPNWRGNRRDLLGLTGLAAASTLLAACASPADPAGGTALPQRAIPSPSLASAGGGVLLAYFSRAGENYFNGGRINLATGNTEVVAGQVSDLLRPTVFRIEASDPYPTDYAATVARNVEEVALNARPRIAAPLPDLADFDTLLLGSPIWAMRPPPIMTTFLEGLDLTGKRILPFVTYAVSGLASTMSHYRSLCPEATIEDGLAIRGEEAAQAGPQVEAWLRAAQLSSD